jgi:hypothetical protein
MKSGRRVLFMVDEIIGKVEIVVDMIKCKYAEQRGEMKRRGEFLRTF